MAAFMNYCVCLDAPSWERQFREWDSLPDIDHRCTNRRGQEVECGRARAELRKNDQGIEKLYAISHGVVRIPLEMLGSI
jgi:hypothetical protein